MGIHISLSATMESNDYAHSNYPVGYLVERINHALGKLPSNLSADDMDSAVYVIRDANGNRIGSITLEGEN